MNFKTAPARIIIILLVLFTLPPLTGCSNNMAGAVSETTNGAVSTTLIGTDNQVITEAEITLIPTTFLFNEDSSAKIHSCTLRNGSFTFPDSIESGMYNLIIKSQNFHHLIKTEYSQVEDSFTNIDDSIYLNANGSFKGEILVPERVPGETLFVRPVGINEYAIVDEFGAFSFHNIPSEQEIEFQVSKRSVGDFGPSIYDNFTRTIDNQMVDSGFQHLPNSDFYRQTAIIRNIYDINGHRSKTIMTNYPKDSLALKNMKLDTLPSIIALIDIPNLNLSHNNLTTLPDELYEIKGLHTLTITDNELSSISSAISNAIELKSLNLSNNDLTMLPESITTLNSLTVNVNNNKLTGISETIKNWITTHTAFSDWLDTQID